MAFVSSKNYSGGVALQRLHNIQKDYINGEYEILIFTNLLYS